MACRLCLKKRHFDTLTFAHALAAEYPLLMGLLRHRTHKDLAIKIIQTIVEGGTRISSVEEVAMLLQGTRGHREVEKSR